MQLSYHERVARRVVLQLVRIRRAQIAREREALNRRMGELESQLRELPDEE